MSFCCCTTLPRHLSRYAFGITRWSFIRRWMGEKKAIEMPARTRSCARQPLRKGVTKKPHARKVIAFDLDNTLIGPGRDLLREAGEVLRRASRSFTIALASMNPRGRDVLQELNLLHLFDVVVTRQEQDKCPHLREIAAEAQTRPEDVILFDDLPQNVIAAETAGFRAAKVVAQTGVTRRDFYGAVRKHWNISL